MSLVGNIGRYFVNAKISIAVAMKVGLKKTATGINSEPGRE
jgi:hypothetical protein